MEWLERAALAELLSGNMHMHFFFAVSSEYFEEGIVDIERPDIADFVPVLRDIDGAVLNKKYPKATISRTTSMARTSLRKSPMACER